MREALLDLAHEGLVEIVRNRGFRIVRLTEEDLDEIFRLRLMLEVPAIAQICGRLTVDELAEHRGDAEAIARHAREGDLAAFLDADRRFHLGLLARAKNRRLCAIVDRLRNEARLYGLPALLGSQNLIASADEHLAFLDALEANDTRLVQELMTRHLEHTRGMWAGRGS